MSDNFSGTYWRLTAFECIARRLKAINQSASSRSRGLVRHFFGLSIHSSEANISEGECERDSQS